MFLIKLIKKNILRNAEKFLFFIVDKTPDYVSLFVSRLFRKILFREKFREVNRFDNFEKYKFDLTVLLKKNLLTEHKNSSTN